jgi:hypothetical protein
MIKKRWLLLILFILIISSVMILGSNEEKTKEYDPLTQKITIKNKSNDLLETDLTLKTSLNHKVIYGKNRTVAEIHLYAYEKMKDFWGEIELYENDGFFSSPIDRPVYFKKKIINEIAVPTYSNICNPYIMANESVTSNCTQIENGTTIREEITWEDIDTKKIIKKGDNFTFGIITDVLSGDDVEWVPTFNNIRIPEWAVWQDSWNDGLVAYFDFNSTNFADRVLIDRSGVSPNLTSTLFSVNKGNWTNNGKIGEAFNFTVSEYFQSIEMININGTQNRSVFCWVNTTTTNSFGLISWGDNVNNQESTLGFRNSAPAGVTWEGFNVDVLTDIATPKGLWSFIGYTISEVTPHINANITLYSNATSVNSEIENMNTALSVLEIGRREVSPSWEADGFIDECGIWNRTLSESEISAIYDNHAGSTHRITDSQNPVVIINDPKNITYNGTEINFNITSNDNILVNSCWYSINEGVDNITIFNTSLSEFYTINLSMSIGSKNAFFYCNDTSNNINNTENVVFFVNPINPNLTINSPINSTEDTTPELNITFQTPFSGSSFSYCYFNVTTLGGGVQITDTEIVNCSNITMTSLSSNTYILNVWINDTYNNVNFTNDTFTISSASPPTGGGGGGGGGATVIIGDTETQWDMRTETGASSYQLNMIQGTSKVRTLVFENLGDTQRDIDISCDGNLCQHVDLETSSLTLPVAQGVPVAVDVTIDIPEGFERGDYIFNILAKDEQGREDTLTFEINLETFNFIIGIGAKLTSSKQIGDIKIPYIVLLFFITILSILLWLFLVFRPLKIAGGTGIAIILGTLTGLVIIGFI